MDSTQRSPSALREQLPLFIFLAGLVIALMAGWSLYRRIDAEAGQVFRHEAERLSLDVQRRFRQAVYGLQGARGMYAALMQVDRAQFRAYVASRNLAHDFPGVRGFGYIAHLPRSGLAPFLAAQRADGTPQFQLRELDDRAHADVYVIQFIEPVEPNLSALGLDVGSEPRRRIAIVHSIDSGEATLTARIPLVQDAHKRPGFLLYLPVYRTGATPDDAAGRRAALQGVLYAPIVASELLGDLYDIDAGLLDFELLDTAGAAAPADQVERVFASRDRLAGRHAAHPVPPASERFAPGLLESAARPARYQAAMPLPLPGRTLTLQVRSTPAFEQAIDQRSPWLVLAAGALASAMLAALLRQQLSGRRRAEALAESMTSDLDQLALVARTAFNAVVITDAQRRITWVNGGFERLSGYSLKESLGQTPGKLLHYPGTDRGTVERINAALVAGRPISSALLNRAKNGRIYMVELAIQPVHDAAGRITSFISIESDITERHAAETALRASEAFLDKAGRIGGVGGWAVDLATGQIKLSDQTCRILEVEPGYQTSVAEALALCAPQARHLIDKALAEGFDTSTGWDFELPVVTTRGRPIWVRAVAEGEFADSGPVRVVGALQDITARRAMEAEVQRSAQLLRGAIDAIDEAFVLYDPDDCLVLCNDKFRTMYSTSADLIVTGARFEDILRRGAERGQYPAAVGRIDAWVAERLQGHRSGDSTVIQHLDGGRVLRIIERKLADGHIVGFRIDITDLMRAKEAAENANRAKSEFIATISHELRTPLQAVIGFSELGQHFAQGQAQFEQLFDEVLSGGQRMLTLVNGLLDVSKIDGTAGSMTLRHADLARLAGDVVRELGPMARARDLSIDTTALQAVLPVRVDTFRLQQVIRNVLANAMRFAPPGSRIELGGQVLPGTGVVLSVRDHGPGIPDDELESIFEAFVQSSRTRDGSGGTGLGLTICRKIMRAHGGRIQAGNAADGGAVMTLHLPPDDHPGAAQPDRQPSPCPADSADTSVSAGLPAPTLQPPAMAVDS